MSRAPSEDSRRVARSAARWLALVESGHAREQDHAGLQHWRELHSSHEQAWQRVQALRSRFQGLPGELAMASLDRPAMDRRRVLKGALGLTLLAPAAWLALRELPVDAWRADISTETGERRQMVLTDGGRLHLNTSSAANIDEAQRQLSLIRGELSLQLAPDAAPYRIVTPQGHALLVAGQLCVRQFDEGCEFSVFSGVSRLGSLELQAGQRVRIQQGRASVIQRFDPQAPDWREGVILANDQPLGDFLRELDRYRPGILRWSPALERLRVTGSFRLDDTEQILDLLAASLPLEVNRRTRYWVTLVTREANA